MNIYKDNVLNVYRYGSHVYGTNNANSDEDYIVVTEYADKPSGDNYQTFTKKEFQILVDNHNIAALECLFLPEDKILQEKHWFTFILNKAKLRTSISTITSNSWVKGRKKLTVDTDYDKNIGMKSYFHSIRILNFGIQIASSGRIENYSAMNYVLDEIRKLGETLDGKELSEAIETKFKKTFNALSSDFKVLCPKNTEQKELKARIKKVLDDYEILDGDNRILDEIMLEINK